MPIGSSGPRFLALSDVAEVLNVSQRQAYALVRRGDLPAIQVGGRGQWRVEVAVLERYIKQQYAATEQYIHAHPFGDRDDDADGGPDGGDGTDSDGPA